MPFKAATGRRLWGISVSPGEIVRRWAVRTGVFTIIAWLFMSILWWCVARHTSEVLGASPYVGVLYVLSGGLCLGSLAQGVAKYIRSNSIQGAAECVIICVVALAFGIPTSWVLAPMAAFPVFMLVKSTVSFHSDWLSEAADSLGLQDLRQSRATRPCPVLMPQPLLVAASFTGFFDLLADYARWAARQRFISDWRVDKGCATFFLSRACGFWQHGRGSRHSSWIRVDGQGNCAAYVCPEDFRRFRGRSYRGMCEELAQMLSNSLCQYLSGGMALVSGTSGRSRQISMQERCARSSTPRFKTR